MSVNLQRLGNLAPPVTTALTTADATTILTGRTTSLMVVEAIVLTNVDLANACEITLRWVNATPTAVIFWQGDIAAGTTVVIDNIPIVVDGKGTVRSLTAEAEAANDVNVTVITSTPSRQAQVAG